ncbi:putative Cell division control protein 6 [Paratrimastix pyriformis]|uniref:Origin recognition complex subunit 1 n=1 Tax=Paratrimastix pyriformis TaxID=342808 RepID=A0ABQ8UZX2_9EUKA|nr:putative Cell division control protein 6 [Paratrimastix pyriformis]
MAEFDLALQRTELSYIPKELPCRTTEKVRLINEISQCFDAQKSSSFFLWGPPGTGKTATFFSVTRELLEKKKHFHFLEVNSFQLAHPAQIYAHIWNFVKTVAEAEAQPQPEELPPTELAPGALAKMEPAQIERLFREKTGQVVRSNALYTGVDQLASPHDQSLIGHDMGDDAESSGFDETSARSGDEGRRRPRHSGHSDDDDDGNEGTDDDDGSDAPNMHLAISRRFLAAQTGDMRRLVMQKSLIRASSPASGRPSSVPDSPPTPRGGRSHSPASPRLRPRGNPGLGTSASALKSLQHYFNMMHDQSRRTDSPIRASPRRRGRDEAATIEVPPHRAPLLVMVDEVDYLLDQKGAAPSAQRSTRGKAQNVFFHLFDWASCPGSRLVLVSIANRTHFLDKLSMREQSRLAQTRLLFAEYSAGQLQQIIESRLAGLSVFAPETLSLMAKEIAHAAGDLRVALQICHRALTLAQEDHTRSVAKTPGHPVPARVTLRHIDAAVAISACDPVRMGVRQCAPLQRLFLAAFLRHIAFPALQSDPMWLSFPAPQLQHVLDRFAELSAPRHLPVPELEDLTTIVRGLLDMGLIETHGPAITAVTPLRLACGRLQLRDALRDAIQHDIDLRARAKDPRPLSPLWDQSWLVPILENLFKD